MKIGIILYSKTGNTYSVAEKLKEKLIAQGHSVNIERITTPDEAERDIGKIRIESMPDLGVYDGLIFGGQVHAFSLSIVMKAYMSKFSLPENKKIACFVTMGFPYAWMGGKNTISQMKTACESKGGKVIGTGIVNWPVKKREKSISDLLENFGKLF